MATLQKFKLLTALHCTTAGSVATTSPSPPRISTSSSSSSSNTTTPNSTALHCFQFGSRLTLKRILSRRFICRKNLTDDRSMKESLLTSHKLKDLFASSPPHLVCEKFEGVGGFGSLTGRVEEYPVRQPRPRFGSMGLRYRLLRGAWRPRLVAIAE